MRDPHYRIRAGAALVAGLVLALCLPAIAQYREYNISGQVIDSQKNPLEGVEINLRDQATSRSFKLKTKKDGSFKFVGLPHGLYQVTLTKEGFAVKIDEWRFETPQDKMVKVEIPPVVMVAAEVIAQAEKMKEAAAGVKQAAEKVRSGDFDGAIAALGTILEKNPTDSNALYILGQAQQKKERWPEAVAAYLKVNELIPGFAPAHYQLGVCYQQMGEPDKALAAYGKAMELDPSNPDSAYNAGLIHFGRSQVPEALALFEKALALRPDDPAYLEMAGRCYIHKADFAKAIDFLERAKAGYAVDAEKAKFLDDLIAKLKEQIKK
jgi:tetratricopeptide (TPR) repeat protein